MPNGKNLSIEQARTIIRKFRTLETTPPRNTPVEQLAIGHKIDLSVLRSFIEAIDNHDHADEIDAVRIYLARSTRSGSALEHFDIVLVPVLRVNDEGKDLDLHKVYDKDDDREILDTLVGYSLPCPNVCPDDTGAFC